MTELGPSTPNSFADFIRTADQADLSRKETALLDAEQQAEAGYLAQEQQNWAYAAQFANRESEMRLFGTLSGVPQTSEDGQPLVTRADQIRGDRNLSADPRERARVAYDYEEDIRLLTADGGLELFQAEEIAEAHVRDRTKLFELAGRFVAGEGGIRHADDRGETEGGSMEAGVAVTLARKLYDRKDISRMRKAMLANPYARQIEIDANGAPSASEQQAIAENRERTANIAAKYREEKTETTKSQESEVPAEEAPETKIDGAPAEKLRMNRAEWSRLVAEVRKGPGVTSTYFEETLGYSPAATAAIFSELQHQGIIAEKSDKMGLYAVTEQGEWLQNRVVSEGEVAIDGLTYATRGKGQRRLRKTLKRGRNPHDWEKLGEVELPKASSSIAFSDEAPDLPRIETLAERRVRQQHEMIEQQQARRARPRDERDREETTEEDDADESGHKHRETRRPNGRTDSRRPSEGGAQRRAQSSGTLRPSSSQSL